MRERLPRGFTLVEVLVALMIVAIGLAALMNSISGAANASRFLRDKALAEWIAMNRIVEVRLNLGKSGENTDKGELDYANRRWHYDTRYYDTSIPTMRRIVVRVWAGKTDTKGNPVAEANGFLSTALAVPGGSNLADWRQGSLPPLGSDQQGTGLPGAGVPPDSR